MNTMLTQTEIIELTKYITNTCETILLRNGPFLKEGVYQDILVNELQNNSISISRELVFPYQMKDTEGNNMVIGNCQSLRSDIELTKFFGILELKSSGSATKDENIFQLRNYLENREDRTWGLLINFISKFTQNGGAKVQVSLLIKGDESNTLLIQDTTGKNINIRRYYREDFETMEYPTQSQLFMSLDGGVREENEVVDDSMENDNT